MGVPYKCWVAQWSHRMTSSCANTKWTSSPSPWRVSADCYRLWKCPWVRILPHTVLFKFFVEKRLGWLHRCVFVQCALVNEKGRSPMVWMSLLQKKWASLAKSFRGLVNFHKVPFLCLTLWAPAVWGATSQVLEVWRGLTHVFLEGVYKLCRERDRFLRVGLCLICLYISKSAHLVTAY